MNPNLKTPSGTPLNPEQKKAAEAATSPLLIVAGAGTGKTRTLTSRIVHLIAAGTPPERICAITFTNKAAAEMKHRIGGMIVLPPKSGTPYIGTFHSLGARILRKECRTLGREPNFTIFDDHDSSDLLKKVLKAMGHKEARGNKKETPAYFLRRISELKNVPPKEEDQKVRDIFAAYESALQRNNAFDFDDLIEKPVNIFREHPEILQRHRDRFDAILVDEYQDINPMQYQLVKLLAGGHRNLTVVGDDEQTIYTWRHADIKIFLDFDKDWPDAKIYFLEENYRSTGNIIRGASAVVQNNRFRTPKQLWTSQDAGAPITLYEAWGENDEAAWVAQKISDVRRATNGTPTPAPTIAILYRTNAQSRAIEQALIRENIPYKIFGGLKFYERREVKDAVAALRYTANQKDELSRERLEKNLTKRKFIKFHAGIAALPDPKPVDIINLFLETFAYFEYLDGNFINADERAENIAELISFASGFENLPDFIERLSLLQATDDENASSKALDEKARTAPIHLSTVHMAKGLEFDTVFIAGAAEGLLPHIRSIESDASLEEERRLMYVAMTRARKNLYVSFYGLPSRFIGEIPEEYVTLSGDAARAAEEDVRYQRDDDFGDNEGYVTL
jgi:DNA helicase-2/ATP-dependent DNA helicase PcrA